jgi:rubrerythrin
MPNCQSMEEVYAFVTEREVKSCVMYRFAAESVVEEQAKLLLEKLVQRGEAYLEKLAQSRKSGVFKNRGCNLPDRSFFSTIKVVPEKPGQRLAEILMFAISSEQDDYRVCKDAAQKCQVAPLKSLWLALAEEERRQRLELESYYEKEVINKI